MQLVKNEKAVYIMVLVSDLSLRLRITGTFRCLQQWMLYYKTCNYDCVKNNKEQDKLYNKQNAKKKRSIRISLEIKYTYNKMKSLVLRFGISKRFGTVAEI